MTDYLAYIDDQTPGRRSDVTPLFANADAFGAAVDDLLEKTAALNWNIVAGIDALGFALGGALAARRGCGLVAIRKQAKLPVLALRESYAHFSGGTDVLELAFGAHASSMSRPTTKMRSTSGASSTPPQPISRGAG